MKTIDISIMKLAEMLTKFVEKADEKLDVVKITDSQGNDLSRLDIHIVFDKSINYPKRRI